jgi:hypothetical protein
MTDVSQTSPDLEHAFEELVVAATTLLRQGRAPRSAAVKAALQLQTEPRFNEAAFGFTNFRAFLRAAEDAGRVEVRPASVGPDVDVIPRGTEVAPEVNPARPIRRDIWDAFTRWEDGYIRFWDPALSRAIRTSLKPLPGEAPEVTRIRRAWLTEPQRFVPIDGIPVSAVKVWAREFAEGLPPGAAQNVLRSALSEKLPIHDFAQSVRRLGLLPKWHETHVAKVRSVIEDWMSKNDLAIDLSSDAALHSGGRLFERNVAPTSGFTSRTYDEDDLRRRVHAVVDRMTVPELLSISVPLRLVVG